MRLTIEDLRAILELKGLRPGPIKSNSVRSSCPIHGGNSQAFGFRWEPDITLVNCFAACDTRECLDELGLGWADLFPDRERVEWGRRPPRTPGQEVVYLFERNAWKDSRVSLEWKMAKWLVRNGLHNAAVTYGDDWWDWVEAKAPDEVYAWLGPRRFPKDPERVLNIIEKRKVRYPESWPAPHVNIFSERLRAHGLNPMHVFDLALFIDDCLSRTPRLEEVA